MTELHSDGEKLVQKRLKFKNGLLFCGGGHQWRGRDAQSQEGTRSLDQHFHKLSREDLHDESSPAPPVSRGSC